MPCRRVAIVLLLAVLLQALANGAGGVRVLCLGGGHEHTPMQADHCDRSCAHGGEGMLPRPADRSEHGCGCTDVELAVVELLAAPGVQAEPMWRVVVHACWSWYPVPLQAAAPEGDPPSHPPDAPGARCAHRRAIVSCVRLNV